MRIQNISGLIALISLTISTPAVYAFGVSHHGGIILDCTPPLFFDESPAREAQVNQVRDFSFVASDNTDAETLKVWVNNQPIPFTITELRSGRLEVKGTLPETVTSGKVWFKVTGVSKDGCDELHNWNAFVNP